MTNEIIQERKGQKTISLAKMNYGNSMPSWKVKAIEQTGATKSKTQLVALAMTDSIRKTDPVIARRELLALIPLVAKEYGARYDIGKNVVIEAVRIILMKFSFLGFGEIREAYREWTTGEIEVKGGQMWGGEFTVAQMTFVLSAYCNNRKKIAAELDKQKTLAEEEAEEEARKEAANAKFEIDFPRLIEEGKEKYTHWQQVPEFWFKAAWKRKLIIFELGEADSIRVEAERIAALEMAAELRESKSFSSKIANRTKTPQAIGETSKEWMDRNPKQEAKVKRIARKISVFRKLIEPFQEK